MNILLSAILLFSLAFLGGKLLSTMKLPGLIGMILVGIILGPYQINWLSEDFLVYSPIIRQIALVIILLRAGLSLKLSDFKTTGKATVLMSFLPALVEMAGVTVLAMGILSFPLADSLLLASILAAVSPAVIVPKMIGIIEKGYGQTKKIPQLILAAASLDDVVVLVLFTTFLTLTRTATFDLNVLLTIPASIALGALVGFLGGKVLGVLFKPKQHLYLLVAMIFFAIGVFWLEEVIVCSAMISIITMAMTLHQENEEASREIKKILQKGWLVAEVFLFGLVGAAVNLSILGGVGFLALLVLIGGLFARSIGVILSLSSLKWTFQEKLFCIISYWPKATVQAAIGSVPLMYHLPNGEIILAVSVIAILFTAPVGAIGIEKTYDKWLDK